MMVLPEMITIRKFIVPYSLLVFSKVEYNHSRINLYAPIASRHFCNGCISSNLQPNALQGVVMYYLLTPFYTLQSNLVLLLLLWRMFSIGHNSLIFLKIISGKHNHGTEVSKLAWILQDLIVQLPMWKSSILFFFFISC